MSEAGDYKLHITEVSYSIPLNDIIAKNDMIARLKQEIKKKRGEDYEVGPLIIGNFRIYRARFDKEEWTHVNLKKDYKYFFLKCTKKEDY